MASLANITYGIRTIGKYAVIAGAGLFVLFLLFQGMLFVWRTINPPKVVPPAMRLGKLTEISFPSQQKPSATYKVNTITGALPNFSDRILVYSIIEPEYELAALQNARANAAELGFTFTERKVDENYYSWLDSKGNTLKYDIIAHNFEILPNYEAQMPPLPLGSVSKTGSVQEYILSLLRDMQISTENIVVDKEGLEYFQNSGAALIPTSNPDNATAVRMYLNHKSLRSGTIPNEKMEYPHAPVVYPVSAPTIPSTLHVTVIPNNNKYLAYQAKMMYQNIDLNNYSDYPIITTKQAFEELQNGNAFFISSNTSPIIDITEVTIGYFIGEEKQSYTLPVIIFKGKEFIAYVNALAPQSIAD